MTIIKISDLREFLACDLLGFSLTPTTASPPDAESVCAQIRLDTDVDPVLPSDRLSPQLSEHGGLSSTIPMKTQKLDVGKYFACHKHYGRRLLI